MCCVCVSILLCAGKQSMQGALWRQSQRGEPKHWDRGSWTSRQAVSVQGLSQIPGACVRGSSMFFAEMLGNICLVFAPWADQASCGQCSCVFPRVQSPNTVRESLPAREAAIYLEQGRGQRQQEKEWSSGSVTWGICRRPDGKPHYIAGLVCRGDGTHKTCLVFILDFCPHVWTPPPFLRSFPKYLSSGWPCVCQRVVRLQQCAHLHRASGSVGDTDGRRVSWCCENDAFLNTFFEKSPCAVGWFSEFSLKSPNYW